MDGPDPRWVLAFDGSCATCRKISSAVFHACDGKLEVLPLDDERVWGWRESALGTDAPWTPTLLRMDAGQVRAWAGAAMTVPLVRRLGPRSTIRVLRALGELRRADAGHHQGRPATGRTLGRAQFLRACAGLSVAAGLIIRGSTPAFAENEHEAASRWVLTHRAELPTTYDDVVAYPLSYRRAIHEALPAKTRSGLWAEHLRRFKSSRPELTAAQHRVVDRALDLAADPATFEGEPPAELTELGRTARETFGVDEARAMLAVLGPAADAWAPAPNCECNKVDVYCGWSGDCVDDGCHHTSTGCGSLYIYPCNGLCYD
ncbi:bacteriocin fulvocin C-related protein [Streptomyces sp. NPDC058371]|uniref:bacteriocin fulvocin C-related protein n=1 Tax=Streptomyces sp. NPDC058371 TaxID=3346463 RepID=UPI00365E2F7E